MTITHAQWVLAKPEVKQVVLERALGYYRLRVTVELEVRGYPDQRRFVVKDMQLRVDVRNREAVGLLGTAFPEHPFVIETMMHSSTANYCFELSLTAHQIGLLEELRAGGDLHLFVSLYALTSESDVTYPCSDSLTFTVPQSNWIKQLNSSKFTDVLLVEVPIGGLAPAHLVTFLQKARNQIATADYRGAIATCRAAMELLAEGEQRENQQAISGFKENPRGMSSEDRLRLIRHAAKHYTHLANHADSESLKASYTLRDAVLLLTLATAFSAHQLDGQPAG